MTKKKPDFLRDLDTAIMDELTGGGIKGNAAGLVGTLTQIKEIKQLCGLPFCGYMAKLETVRPSGVPDEVTVVFAEDVPYRACNGIEFDVMQEFVEGSRLLLTGKGLLSGRTGPPTRCWIRGVGYPMSSWRLSRRGRRWCVTENHPFRKIGRSMPLVSTCEVASVGSSA